jgi:hypothetical protein
MVGVMMTPIEQVSVSLVFQPEVVGGGRYTGQGACEQETEEANSHGSTYGKKNYKFVIPRNSDTVQFDRSNDLWAWKKSD